MLAVRDRFAELLTDEDVATLKHLLPRKVAYLEA